MNYRNQEAASDSWSRASMKCAQSLNVMMVIVLHELSVGMVVMLPAEQLRLGWAIMQAGEL